MQRNVAGQKIRVFAFNRTTNAPQLGDAANITCKLSKDYSAQVGLADVNPTETEDGYYLFDLAQLETDASVLDFYPESSTPDIQVVGVPGTVYTVPANFSTLTIANNAVDADVELINDVPLGGQGSVSAGFFSLPGSYATLQEADVYFEERLYSTLWFNTPPQQREIALKQSTRAIDRLRYRGVKHSVYETAAAGGDEAEQQAAYLTQALEFPRNADVEVPNDIKIACFENAYALLDGVDVEQELRSLSMVSQGYASVRNTYDRTSAALEHFAAGIASALAWRYLRQYIADPGDIKLSRV